MQRDGNDEKLMLYHRSHPQLPMLPSYEKFTDLPQMKYLNKDKLKEDAEKREALKQKEIQVKKLAQQLKELRKKNPKLIMDPKMAVMEEYSNPFDKDKASKASV